MKFRTAPVILLVAAFACVPAAAAAQSSRTLYTRALERERILRDGREPSLQQLRNAVASYEAIARRFPSSGYTDNSLWQGANLSLLAYDRFGQAGDLQTALRLLEQLTSQYPSSSLATQARSLVRQRKPAAEMPAVLPVPPTPTLTSQPLKEPVTETRPSRASMVAIRDVKRTQLPDGIRVSIEMDAESTYHAERLENPRRVFFDIKGARPSSALLETPLKFTDDIVREIRLGRHPNSTRVVMDMEGADSYSVFTLYDPFRLVIDFKRSAIDAARACAAASVARRRPSRRRPRRWIRPSCRTRNRSRPGRLPRCLHRPPRRRIGTEASRSPVSWASAFRGS